MDIVCAGMRDRRVAASDSRLHIPRSGSIQVIILHSTSGPQFLPTTTPSPTPRRSRAHEPRSRRPEPYPTDPRTDSVVRSRHRIDEIAAHFVVINDGTIFYTHDVDFLSRSAGGRFGIDIEFAGSFNTSRRLTSAAVQAGRNLVTALKTNVTSITHIHPHGQIQHLLMNGQACGASTGVRCGKLDSCPGPDVWINVGDWAARRFRLITETPLPNYQNNGISEAQRDREFDQRIP